MTMVVFKFLIAAMLLFCYCTKTGEAMSYAVCERRIKGMYLAAFHRQPDISGFYYHLEKCMVNKGFREMLEEDFYQHPEHLSLRCKERANDLIQYGLGYIPSDKQVDRLRSLCNQGMTLKQQIMEIMSNEYFRRNRTRPNTLFKKDAASIKCQNEVIGLYLMLLHRNPYDYEVKYFARQCQIKKLSFDAMYNSFMSLRERKIAVCEKQIFNIYRQLFNRTPHADTELYTILHDCTEGIPLINVVMKLIDSDEFVKKTNQITS